MTRTVTTPASNILVGTTDAQTLTNKTLTSPAIATPTGIVKGDVGLGNVDNTSDATKNAASVTLTNKTLTTPTIGSFANAAHTHLDAAGGATLTAAAVSDFTAAARAILESYSGQLPYIEPLNAYLDAGTQGTFQSANNAFFVAFRVSEKITLASVAVLVGAAAGNMDGGLYSSDDAASPTLTRLASSGSVAAAGTNAQQTLAFSTGGVTSYECVPGVTYYLAIAADTTTTLTISRFTSSIHANAIFMTKRYLMKASSFPLPTSVTTFIPPATSFIPYLIGLP